MLSQVLKGWRLVWSFFGVFMGHDFENSCQHFWWLIKHVDSFYSVTNGLLMVKALKNDHLVKFSHLFGSLFLIVRFGFCSTFEAKWFKPKFLCGSTVQQVLFVGSFICSFFSRSFLLTCEFWSIWICSASYTVLNSKCAFPKGDVFKALFLTDTHWKSWNSGLIITTHHTVLLIPKTSNGHRLNTCILTSFFVTPTCNAYRYSLSKSADQLDPLDFSYAEIFLDLK